MNHLNKLKVKIFSDGANKEEMLKMYSKNFIQGLTTNPTLMKKAGINDYKEFCTDILKQIKIKPISFEVFADDFENMEKQATEISSWGENVYVKIPITNTKKEPSFDLIKTLSNKKVKLNITALMTVDQVSNLLEYLNPKINNYISVFAGRIADTGRDPIPIMVECLKQLKQIPSSELIWASPRELLNIIQADAIGCHIITVTNDLLNKLHLIDYDLNDFSLDTVKMFYKDAIEAGYKL